MKVFTLPSSYDILAQTIADVKQYLTGLKHPFDPFDLELVLREVLVNGIKHGNQFDDEKQLVLTLKPLRDGLWLEVIDEGPGFNWQEKLSRENVSPESTNGRGMLILKAYCRKVSFNAKGNRVCLEMHMFREKFE